MTRGAPGSEPDGIAADCFYVLAMYATRAGPGLTVAGLQEAVAGEYLGGGPVPGAVQVLHALHGLARRRPPLTAQDAPGRAARWRVTGHGYRMLAAWCGDDEDEQIPCGTGWPPGVSARVRPLTSV